MLLSIQLADSTYLEFQFVLSLVIGGYIPFSPWHIWDKEGVCLDDSEPSTVVRVSIWIFSFAAGTHSLSRT
jgi:hypothetical protein